MFYIGYANKPDEKLFSFSSIGDAVRIGRDKRVCEICLGATAQGVSRVHMCIELKQQGSELVLLSKDMSTYGSGFNGGELTVENRERELHPGDTLQIGHFNFIIGQLSPEEIFSDNEFAIGPINENARSETATANGELRGNVKRDAIKRPSNSEDVLVVKRSKNNERNKLLTAHEDYGPVGTQPVLSNKMVVGAGTLCARTSFLEDVDARTQTKTQPRVLANDTCATQSSANGQMGSCLSRSQATRSLLPSEDSDSDNEPDAKERAATGSRVLAEDSSDEEASHKKRTVIDDEVRTTVAESVMDGDDSRGELIHRDLFDLEKRINRNNRRRLNWNTLDNENLSEITENTVLDDSIIAGPANQSRIADLGTQFLLNPVLHSTQRSAHHMNLAQRRTSTAVSAGNSTTSRNAKITSSRTFKGAVEGSTVASAREKRQVLKQRERSPKGGEQKSLKEEWESQKEGAQLRSAFESRERSSEGDGECESDARLISWVNTTKRSVVPSAFIDTKELRNEVEGIRSKRIKVEPVDNNEGLDNSANEADNAVRANGTGEKDDSAAMLDAEMEQEEQDDNLILGLDLETLRRKLAKVVEYCDLEKHKPGYSHVSNENVTSSVGVSNISARSALATPNFKRFVKAPQGCHSQGVSFSSHRQPITQIIGATDMVDFRKL